MKYRFILLYFVIHFLVETQSQTVSCVGPAEDIQREKILGIARIELDDEPRINLIRKRTCVDDSGIFMFMYNNKTFNYVNMSLTLDNCENTCSFFVCGNRNIQHKCHCSNTISDLVMHNVVPCQKYSSCGNHDNVIAGISCGMMKDLATQYCPVQKDANESIFCERNVELGLDDIDSCWIGETSMCEFILEYLMYITISFSFGYILLILFVVICVTEIQSKCQHESISAPPHPYDTRTPPHPCDTRIPL